MIPGPLHRKPSHLHDAHATVYKTPHFEPDSDEITDAKLHEDRRTGRRRRRLVRRRRLPEVHPHRGLRRRRAAVRRARAGQVGAGRAARRGAVRARLAVTRCGARARRRCTCRSAPETGTSSGSFYGDHDLFRLPQDDDHNRPRSIAFAAAHRPVSRRRRPGTRSARTWPDGSPRRSRSPRRSTHGQAPRRARLRATRWRILTHGRHGVAAEPVDDRAAERLLSRVDLARRHGTRHCRERRARERLHRSAKHWLIESAHWARGYLQHGARRHVQPLRRQRAGPRRPRRTRSAPARPRGDPHANCSSDLRPPAARRSEHARP